MFRSLVMRGALALAATAVPVGVAVAAGDDSTPDESAPTPSGPASSQAQTTEDTESGPPSASEPSDVSTDDTSTEGSAGENGGGMAPPGDIEFQIDMMLGLVPEDEMNEHWASQNQQQELGIQACMNESGFEYIPQDMSQMVFSDPTADMPRLEYAEQYGFGMWTTMDPELDPYASTGNDYEWPNQDIVDALSESEQNAWYEVNSRCSMDAYNNADNDPWRNPEVQQAMDDFNSDVENDSRMREAKAAWVACMEEAGHPYPSQDDMWRDVNGDDDDYSLHEQFYESEAWKPTSEDHAQWQQLVDHEIEVAVANAGCQPALDEVRDEVQTDLRDDLIAVWQTIDWSLPPVTFEGEG